jgi:hypothetical protein
MDSVSAVTSEFYIGEFMRWSLGACGSVQATSWKVAGSSPNEVDFVNLNNPSSRIMALGSTQTLTEMNTRNLPGG